MKRCSLWIVFLLLMISACRVPPLGQRSDSPGPRPTRTLRIPDDVPAPPTCGNNICESSENPFTCPTDCPKPTIASTPAARPSTPAAPTAQPALQRPANPQIGLNFIRFYWSDRPNGIDTTTPYLQPNAILADFKDLGVQAFRQVVKADLLWDIVEPRDNQWNFAQADVVLANPNVEPIVTLFSMQYASPTPPWATSPQQFQKTMGTEANDYVETVVKRYASYVKYWELGNEMSHWRAADPGTGTQGGRSGVAEERLPAAFPSDGYSPREQGIFLAQAAALIRKYDSDAMILMPGLASLGDYEVDTWLSGVIAGGGKDWFDIVNYHFYSSWEQFTLLRPRFQDKLKKLGLERKPVWMTETGVTSLSTLTIRTDYPNSPETQAADVFRRLVAGWGNGDAFVAWHTYISSNDTDGNWAAYGIRTDKGKTQPSYFALRLLASEVVPFASVDKLAADGRGVNAYKVTTAAGAVKYVVWGKGNYTLPAGVTQVTTVVPLADGAFAWQAAQSGKAVTLSANPLLIK